MSNYLQVAQTLQAALQNARAVINAVDVETPYIVRSIDVAETRLGNIEFQIARFSTLEIIASRTTQAFAIFDGREFVLRVSHEGSLESCTMGIWTDDLEFLMERIDEQRATRPQSPAPQPPTQSALPERDEHSTEYSTSPRSSRWASVPSDLEDQRTEQCRMFQAARDACLDSNDRDAMRDAFNDYFGWNLSSRSEMDALMNRRAANAIRSNAFRSGWAINTRARLRAA